MTKVDIFNLEAYDYFLPYELVAQSPADPPDNCKLLIIDSLDPLFLKDEIFKNIIKYLNGNEIFFFNDTKVIKARIYLNSKFLDLKLFNVKGDILNIKEGEIFFIKSYDEYTFEALVRPGKKFKIGNKIVLDNNVEIFIKDYSSEGRILQSSIPVMKLFEKYGHLPLPPYVKFEEEKEKYYQSVFASKPGSVAAPTASLHFTNELIEKIKDKGCQINYATLHVGLGTFKKVDTKDITQYDIHEELVTIEKDIFEKIYFYKINKNPIIAVGTTITRTLESLPYLWNLIKDKYSFPKEVSDYRNNISKNKNIIKLYNITNTSIAFYTKLYIYPGFNFQIIDELITNFHLPKSSLLMLVAAFMGYDNMMKAYKHAIEKKYKFFSFGDAMWIKGNI